MAVRGAKIFFRVHDAEGNWCARRGRGNGKSRGLYPGSLHGPVHQRERRGNDLDELGARRQLPWRTAPKMESPVQITLLVSAPPRIPPRSEFLAERCQ